MSSTDNLPSLNRDDARVAESARDLPTPPPPPALRDNITAAFHGADASIPAPYPRRRLVIGTLAVAGLAALAIFAPHHLVTATVSAAEIGDAIQKTNTWHLSGWRLDGAKKVRWDVWGRRYPFFYREQIGDEIVIDDGKKRLHLLPPQRMHPVGLLLVQSSHPLTTAKSPGQTAYDTTAFLSGTSGDYGSRFTLKTGNTGPLILESAVTSTGLLDEQVTVTADRKTLLPSHYKLVRRTFKSGGDHPLNEAPEKEWTKATLQATYNTPVPLDVLQEADTVASPPPGYRVVDFTTQPETPSGPEYGVAHQGGITAVCNAVARDAEGNLKLKYQVWLGDVITRTYNNLLEARITPGESSPEPGRLPRPTDTAGQTYLHLNAPDGDTGAPQNEFSLGYFASASPPTSDTSRAPVQLTLPIRVEVTVIEDDPENGMRERSLAAENVTLTVPLPAEVKSLEYDRPRPQMPGLIWEHAGPQRSLLLQTSLLRGVYLNHVGRDFRPPATPAELKAARHYYNLALSEAQRTDDKQMLKDIQLNLKAVERELSSQR